MNKSKCLFSPWKTLLLITANASIVISLMHLTFHFINNVNASMGFLDNEATYVLMLILFACSAITSIGVMTILGKRESKSYFFRKVAFINFWVCIISVFITTNTLLAHSVTPVHKYFLWFLVSMFTLPNSVFCNGLLVTKSEKE